MSDTQYDRTTQDVGNILGLEHVNLVIDDRDLADRFYVSALGCTRDAYMDLGMFGNTWVNLGGQQMHLPQGDQPQRFRGRIGLVVPDPDAVGRRVNRLVEKFPVAAASKVACAAVDGGLSVTCPWGNEFRIHGPDEFDGFAIGMPYVEVDIGPGAAAGVAAFYQEILGAPASVEEGPGPPTAVITVGRRQQMRFRETSEPLPDYDGHHVAVYLHNFSQPYQQLRDRGLITRETDAHEYRFQDIVEPGSGAVCAVLEHEVRSMFHPMFGRELVNRNASQGLGPRYHQGHDAQPGLHHSGVG